MASSSTGVFPLSNLFRMFSPPNFVHLPHIIGLESNSNSFNNRINPLRRTVLPSLKTQTASAWPLPVSNSLPFTHDAPGLKKFEWQFIFDGCCEL
jgi:hypothetical protein